MIKNLVRNLVPKSLREARWESKQTERFQALDREWRALPARLSPVERSGGFTSFLIFPGDPEELVGSVGDEAMITASAQMARALNPDVRIHILVDGEKAAQRARDRGLIPIDIWDRTDDFLAAFATALRDHRIDATVAVGADIIDGVYGILVPARMICAADIAVRMGVAATILGSSFNKRPRAELAPLFNDADSRVAFLLRDGPSLERFGAFTTASGTLVADSAFMLQADTPDPQIAGWVDARRAAGRTVIGFNLHPMLVKEDPPRVAALIESAVAALSEVIEPQQLSVVMIPHDRRADVGDMVILGAVHERLKDSLGDNLLLVDANSLSAAGLKGLAGMLDGVVTGRMHLAIGALGKGTPVLCVSYQDKFEGLFGHFGLPLSMLMEVPEASDPQQLAARLTAFVTDLAVLRAKVGEALPNVLAQSRRNFAAIEESKAG